jgi:hypothetical protein
VTRRSILTARESSWHDRQYRHPCATAVLDLGFAGTVGFLAVALLAGGAFIALNQAESDALAELSRIWLSPLRISSSPKANSSSSGTGSESATVTVAGNLVGSRL